MDVNKNSVTRLISSILRTYTLHNRTLRINIMTTVETIHIEPYMNTPYTTGGFIIFMRKFIYFLKDKRKNRVFTHICAVWIVFMWQVYVANYYS